MITRQRENSLRLPLRLLLLWTLTVQTVNAADISLEAQVRLKTPKKEGDRSKEGGLEHVPFAVWMPEGVKTIRGFVFNPFYTKAVTQEHWQAACRQWDFGILAGNLFGAKKDEFPEIIDSALSQFAERSGHPEIVRAKLCPVGMSSGAGMSVSIAEMIPDRVIAVGPVCLEVGPKSPATLKIPMLTIFGEKDGKQYELLRSKLPEARAQQGLFGIAIQWRRKHEFGKANNLLVPFFAAVIRHRLGEPGEPLREIDESTGWLGDISSWETGIARVAPFQEFDGDRTQACWFPDELTARCWQAFVTKEEPLTLKQPAGLGDDQPLLLHTVGEPIQFEARTKGDPKSTEGVEIFSGSQRLGTFEAGTTQITFDQPGAYPLILRRTLPDGTEQLSRPSTIFVTAGK